MPAERTPPTEASFLARPLAVVTGWLLRAPKAVIVVGTALAIVSILAAVKWLGVHTSRLDLLNPESSYNQRWLAYLGEFGDQDDVVVVVEGRSQGEVSAALDELAASLSAREGTFRSVFHKRDLSRLRSKGLHYLPTEDLRQIERFLTQFDPELRDDWSQLGAEKLLRRRGEQLPHRVAPQERLGGASGESFDRPANPDPVRVTATSPPSGATTQNGFTPAAAEISRFSASLVAAFDDPPRYQSPWPEAIRGIQLLATRLDSSHLMSDDGRLGFVLLRLAMNRDRFDQGSHAVAVLREVVGEVQSRHRAARIGLTGMPVLENDEMKASQRDTIGASILSLVGVACVFIAGFGGWKRPLMTVAALMLAIAWSFGYITLVVGHLNILSMAFGVILIGLGIDFGVHYVARYMQVRESASDCASALVETARSVGPGIIAGGLTTALAFCTAALTHFTGVAELGVIAAGGVVLCMIAALAVLPAMVYLYDRQRRVETPPALPVAAMCYPLSRHPKWVLAGALLVTAALGLGLVQLRYDHNLLNLQPLRLESVALEKRLSAAEDRSVWFAVSMAQTRDELLRRKARFEALEAVAGVEEIVSLLTDEEVEKSRIIARLRDRLGRLPDKPPLIPVVGQESLARALAQRNAALQRDVFPVSQVAQLSPPDYFRRLSWYQQRLATDLLETLHLIRSMVDPAAPQLEDLPSGLVQRFVGQRGRHLLRVYPRGNIWDMEQLEHFIKGVESIDPSVTGHPVQTYYASRQMQESYIHAAVYSLLAVSVVLMLDFQSIRYWLLAMLPMGLGMLQMFGLLGLLDIPLNPANMIVLPLILGIGIDDGVHVVHDFLRQGSRYRISNSTATAVVVTSATTMIGFGSMMFAAHQGLRSLGQVLTIGVFCCLVSSLVLLPALLTWLVTPSRRTT